MSERVGYISRVYDRKIFSFNAPLSFFSLTMDAEIKHRNSDKTFKFVTPQQTRLLKC